MAMPDLWTGRIPRPWWGPWSVAQGLTWGGAGRRGDRGPHCSTPGLMVAPCRGRGDQAEEATTGIEDPDGSPWEADGEIPAEWHGGRVRQSSFGCQDVVLWCKGVRRRAGWR